MTVLHSSLFCAITVLSLSVIVCQSKEPECPFGSPKIDIADPDKRCDRFWTCEDGLISDMFCSSGNGFDPATKKCHENAPCLKDGSVTSERPAGLARIANILVTKAMPETSEKTNNNFAKTFSSLLTPIILPMIKMFF